MLLEFKTKNYKSFREETMFSMTPAPKQTGLDYSVFSQKAGSKTYKGLSTAVVYGANASGKTNLIGAMDTFRMIMLRGNIKNSDKKEECGVFKTTVMYASDILKRNTDSIRCAVQNDVFSSLPDESLLDTLERGWSDEK